MSDAIKIPVVCAPRDGGYPPMRQPIIRFKEHSETRHMVWLKMVKPAEYDRKVEEICTRDSL